MRVLVLGAYGLIGSPIVGALRTSGPDVIGLARSESRGRTQFPDIEWQAVDIAQQVNAEDWMPILKTIDVVINASGALQDGTRDKIQALQSDAIQALIQACEEANVPRFIQVSATGSTHRRRTAR